ncbi:hypothetical protein [Planktothrix mougeotii]|uniref:Uncharacterized protein n=1 Tax=Planktothrix mougeotii LEGE 06226 TaxID=1828728 RepID=A0ABR9UD44_9CYAN|nr:hypothetical protein [Planktothrix mougeotii]MBE9144086.1 hypothetical protein [Planktothrix mougeotii LEGE 06226]
MTNPKLPKPPLPSNQPNPSLNELIAIKSELKKLNQKVLEIEGAFVKPKGKVKFNIIEFLKTQGKALILISLLLIILATLMFALLHQFPKSLASLDRGLASLEQSLNQPPEYEYQVVSPNDIGFEEAMTRYGSSGWQAVTCRRAKDSLDIIGYECIMIRQKP